MKLLLHICCAPCSLYPLQEIGRDPSVMVTGYYFNPNIHPYPEYVNRRSAVERTASEMKLSVEFPAYDPRLYFEDAGCARERTTRCRGCWKMRLRATARHARANGFDAFSTTLLISPYQDHSALTSIGEEAAAEEKIHFYYRDFRPGFRDSQNEAARRGLYRQKYCGCIYSEMERIEQQNNHPGSSDTRKN
ncbi:MAG: epoxyqueuosine reductase QueH [Candidatus Omnitrophota bacterium]